MTNHNYSQPGSSGVYALRDPRDMRVRYIGSSINIEARYKKHCSATDGTLGKCEWIRALKAVGRRPDLLILEQCQGGMFMARERWHLEAFRASGQADLSNHVNIGKRLTVIGLSAEIERLKAELAELRKFVADVCGC